MADASLSTGPAHADGPAPSMPDPHDAAAWEAYVGRSQAEAEGRVHREVERLRRANVVDRGGRVIPDGLPTDMDPASDTSTITG